jgi:hypothetical protein
MPSGAGLEELAQDRLEVIAAVVRSSLPSRPDEVRSRAGECARAGSERRRADQRPQTFCRRCRIPGPMPQ